ncbi:MAG: phosphoadenosine phosphosulfate reductase family protein, partial [Selenomonadaceae bacterium]|nr:phosphoadenosine phosphosulfate reductase family protein [Selenomonadaceae bacterium]
GYYLCFSGGKDSVVTYSLAVRAGVKFDAHHNVTTVEPPELMKFIRDHYPNVIKESPRFTMAQLIVKKKYPPMRHHRYCCAELKERGGVGRVKITGIRAEESPRRAKRPRIDKLKDGTTHIHPIKSWSTADVWQYIRENNLPYCSLYDEGFHRIGCVLCPFESPSTVQRSLANFPAIVDYYRRACRKSFDVHREFFRDTRPTWQSGDDLFNWWIDDRRKRHVAKDCNSIPLFSEDDGSVL